MKKLLTFTIPILIIIICLIMSIKEEGLNLSIDLQNKKDKVIESKFNKAYNVSLNTNTNTKLAKEIEKSSKQATYLLLGETKESNEDYYERHNSFKKLIYQTKEDQIDNYIAKEMAEYMFNRLSELEIEFSTLGDISVNESKNLVISKVIVPNITLKVESITNPMKYEKKKSNLIIKYYYKENNNKYKIYYITSELKNDLYSNDISYAIKTNNNSLYNYNDINNINNTIYETNKNNIMKLTSYKVNEEITSSIGVLINDSLLLTTYSFLEKSLEEGDFIAVKNIYNKAVNIDGIVTLNKEYNYALIKLKDYYKSTTVIGSKPKIEEGVLAISNIDNEIDLEKGIIISNKNNLITSNDNYNDQIMYDKNNKLLSISINNEFINNEVLKQLQTKTNKQKIDFISIEELQKYFITKTNVKEDNKILPDNMKKHNIIKEIDKNIKLPLVNYSQDNNTISLRYKNNIEEYISSMKAFSSLRDTLKNYEITYDSPTKRIYENNKYQIIGIEEMDYLIIIVVIK